jgi:subtilisin family serine protease
VLNRARRPMALVIVIALMLTASVPAFATDDRDTPQVPPEIQLPDSVLKHEKLDTELVRLIRVEAAMDVLPGPFSRRSERSVPVSVQVDGDPHVTAQSMTDLGAEVADVGQQTVEAHAPVSMLEAIAVLPGVLSVRTIDRPVARVPVISQGVGLHGVPAWNGDGFNGAGIKVGVIDVGFYGYSSLVGSELPAPVVRCYPMVGVITANIADCESGDVHGTAVAETVIDVAPAATMYIANPQTPLQLHDAVEWMIAEGVLIINHSVGWGYEGPGDGTSMYSDGPLAAVDRAVAGGITWVNAAGNEGMSSWTGGYADANADEFLEFTSVDDVNAINVYAGQPLSLHLRWDDSWMNPGTDLDLYLFDSSFNPLVISEDEQSGAFGQEPYERLRFVPSETGTVYAAIRHFGGPAPSWIQMQALSGEMLQHRAASYSMGNPAESRNSGMLAVGAAPWYAPDQIEPFSSQGPTRDGRIKPDVVGIDFADTMSYGPSGFPGTSQASPHVAGLAALVKQRYPGFTPEEIAGYLRANANRSASPDFVWGYGLVQLPVESSTGEAPNSPAYERTWNRTDLPVKHLVVSRTWMWGDGAIPGPLWEEYAEGDGQRRAVKYFDKSRMEITVPSADWTSPWYVTNGLLVVELITGEMQVGHFEFEQREPSTENVAGDPYTDIGPTYATFGPLRSAPALPDGAVITHRVHRDGTVTDDPALAIYGVTTAYHVTVPGLDHQVAKPFWDFMNSTGVIYDGAGFTTDLLFENPFYATGFPITEAYWTTVMVGGTPHNVLVQCFERRCLTYTPENPEGWKVEAGNVGRHYFIWRYNREP